MLSKFKAGKPHQRAKNSSLSYALEELKFLRSLHDLRIFSRNMAYLMPRAVGALDGPSTVPPSLQIEPTNYCNVTCLCCPVSRTSRRKGYMELSLFMKIVDEAAQMGVKRIRLFLHGEPFLHPKIIEMIRHAKAKGLAVHLTTNGMPLTKPRLEALLKSGVDSADHITFSVLGYSRQVHEGVMKGVNHDKVVKNIFDLLELRRDLGINGPVIETIFYDTPENEHEEQEFLMYWRGTVDHVRLGGRISQSFSEYKRETQKVAPRTQTCPNLWERMTIFWNGDVTLCCQDVDGQWLFGNLNERSIKDVWNCERLQSIRQVHHERQFHNFPFCSECDM